MHLNTNMLKEANRRMRTNEARAVTDAALRELRRHPSVKQRLARTLIGVATWLEPGSYPGPGDIIAGATSNSSNEMC